MNNKHAAAYYFNKLYVTSVLGNEHGDYCILMH